MSPKKRVKEYTVTQKSICEPVKKGGYKTMSSLWVHFYKGKSRREFIKIPTVVGIDLFFLLPVFLGFIQ